MARAGPSSPMPRVSVVLPTYNRAAFLKRSIGSVLGQSCRDLELIVVDDGSTDDTERLVAGYVDDRVRYIRRDSNRGAGAARNTGIALAKGRYIAFQDSDDEWLPSKLERQLAVLDKSPADVGVAYSSFWRVDGPSRVLIPPADAAAPVDGDIHRTLLNENFVGVPVVLIKAECFSDGRAFNETLAMFEDWELWLRLSRSYRFRYIPEPLAVSYGTPSSVNSQCAARRMAACQEILRLHMDSFRAEPGILARHYRHIAKTLLLTGRPFDGAAYAVRALHQFAAAAVAP